MSDPTNHDDRGAEEIDSLLGRVRELEPPLETRLANRTAIAEELARVQFAESRRGQPWWRRTISVPIPLAIGLAASVAIAFAATWRSLAQEDSGGPRLPGREITRESVPSPLHLAAATGKPQYYERSVYLVGVGRIDMESGYEIEE